MNDKPERYIEAVSVALVDGDRILLVQRGREPAKGQYAFPGGRVESGETLKQAARRELLEETCVEAGKLELIRIFEISAEETGSAAYRLHVFIGSQTGGKLQSGDDAAYANWFTLADLDALPVTSTTVEVCRTLLK